MEKCYYCEDGDTHCCDACLHDFNEQDAHSWQVSRITRTKTCANCGLLPLEPIDRTEPCLVTA